MPRKKKRVRARKVVSIHPTTAKIKGKLVWKAVKMRPIVVKRRDKVVWKATRASGPIFIFLVDPPIATPVQFVVRPGRTKGIIIPSRTPIGSYHYTAFFEKHRLYGEGTTPIIIVQQ
jgi:hypothetical protein